MNLDEFLKQNGAGARGAENSPAPAPSAQPVREGHLDIDALIGQYGVKQPTQAGASVTIPGVTAPAAPAMPSAPAAAPSVPAAAELPTSRMQPALIEAPKLKMKSAVDELLEAAKGVGGSLFRAKEAEPPTQAQAPRAVMRAEEQMREPRAETQTQTALPDAMTHFGPGRSDRMAEIVGEAAGATPAQIEAVRSGNAQESPTADEVRAWYDAKMGAGAYDTLVKMGGDAGRLADEMRRTQQAEREKELAERRAN